ncbi:MAG: chitinase [Terriglobales bacterium]
MLLTSGTVASAKHINARKRIYAPYLFLPAREINSRAPNSTTPAPETDMLSISQQSGIKLFTLAFIVSSGNDCHAAWYRNLPLTRENAIADEISRFRKSGGDVILSFGGEAGLELAQVCKDVPSLQAQYQAAIDKYKVRILDFDIESSAILDPASVDRRNQALANLQAANHDLLISYTLAVLPTGLLPNGVDLLKNAASHGVTIGNINIMTMDYETTFNPNAMGQNAIDAANAAIKQLQALNIDAPLGLTPMIGMNDVSPQVFTLADAKNLLRYAKSNGRISRIAMWSVARDRACPGTQRVLPDCSGLPQSPFSFSKIFGKF